MEKMKNTNRVDKSISKEKSDLIFLIITAVVTAVIVFVFSLINFFFMGAKVIGTSMCPTLNSGDIVIVNKVKSASVGDIVVLCGEQEDRLIKRVIATAGSVVEFNDDGYVYIDGEKYVDEFGDACYEDRQAPPFAKKTLSENEVFYLGDNRGNSKDGRDYGTCELSQIEGVVAKWSVGSDFFSKVLFWI